MIFDIDNIDLKKIKSKLLKEYIPIKIENRDYIVLFQIGSFFETYFEDAKIFSDITGCFLTTKNIKEIGEIAMSGIPENQVNIYIKKLLNNNFKICLCPQFIKEDGSYYRKLTRKYTKGTLIESEFLEKDENNFIISLFFEKNVCHLAYCDVSTGQFYKTKGNINNIKNEIDKISPTEILLEQNQKKYFEDIILKYNTTFLNSKYFEKNIEDSIIKYCKDNQKEYTIKLNKITEYKIENYLYLNETTRQNLELTRTKLLKKKKGSLISFLNNTKTPMGSRLLKQYLNQPLLDIKKINARLNAIEELIKNKNKLNTIEKFLIQFSDLSRMSSKFSNATVTSKELYNFYQNSIYLENLENITKNFNSKLLKINCEKLNQISDFSKIIKKAINENSFDIKEGYNNELDYYKSELNNLFDEIQNYQTQLKKHLEIKNLKINSNNKYELLIEISKNTSHIIPENYFKKEETKNSIRYTTLELQNYEEKYRSLLHKITSFENELMQDLRKKASTFAQTIRNLAYEVANIDVLYSFAKCAIKYNFIKPTFINNDLYIKEGYHPNLIDNVKDITKNDTELKDGNIIILTGANMSGKSTYLKQNAIICILSQIGCFVPCKDAKIKICDKIFYSQGSIDDLSNNSSSFMIEMKDLKQITDNATNSSLILLDEPAKSTNEKESGNITKAFIEYMLDKFKTKIIIATHNFELTKFKNERIKNYYMNNNKQLTKGTVNKSNSINTAILAGLPKEIISKIS